MSEKIDRRKGSMNQSTQKAIALLEFLSIQPEPVSLNYISKSMGMNNSTTYRFLLSLEQAGYVCHNNEQGKYNLSMKICSLAYNVTLNNDIRRIIAPYLRQLGDIYGEFVCLSMENDMRVVYIDSYSRDQISRTFEYIGKTAPMHCTGTGKLFLSNYDDERLADYEKTRGLNHLTNNTITNLDALKEELSKIRISGYAVDAEECEYGACCAAVPIRNYTNQIVAGISITSSVNNMTYKVLGNNLQPFIDIGEKISSILGYVRDPAQN